MIVTDLCTSSDPGPVPGIKNLEFTILGHARLTEFRFDLIRTLIVDLLTLFEEAFEASEFLSQTCEQTITAGEANLTSFETRPVSILGRVSMVF